MFARALTTASPRGPSLSAAVILVIGLAGSGLGAIWLREHNARTATERFDKDAAAVVSRIEGRMARYEYMLRGARGVVGALGDAALTRDAFHAYGLTRDLEKEFPGARGFGFVRRVQPQDEAEFLRRARRDGAPNFSIRQISPHPGERDVIQYVEPTAANGPAIGLDVASEDRRREAAVQAMETGLATLTAPVTLVQASGLDERGFLLFLPIPRLGVPIATPDQRRAATYGWSYAPLVIDEILAGLDLDQAALQLTIGDRAATETSRFFTTSGADDAGADGLGRTFPITVFNRVWDIDVRARAAFIAGLQQISPILVAGIGIALSLLGATVAYLRGVGQQRQDLVDHGKSRLAAIVQTAGDAIIGKTVDGLVTDWNPAAERLFGFTAQEVFGRTFAELLIPPHLRFEEVETLACIRRGEPAPSRSTLRRHRDGALIAVLASAAPIRAEDGRIIGVASTLRDIRDQVAAEERIHALNANLEQQVVERTAALRDSSALQNAILEHAGYAVIATDLDGTITLFNPAAERMLGYSADAMVGHATPAVFHDPDEVRQRAAALSQDLGTAIAPGFEVFVARARRGLPNVDEWTYIARDGTRLPIVLNVSHLKAEDGRELGFLGIALDLTERYRHEAEMRAAHAGTWNYTVATGRVRMSAECARQHGLGEREIEVDVETQWKPLAHPDDVVRVLSELQASIEQGGSYTIEYRLPQADGSLRWLTAMGRTEADAAGAVTRVIGLTLDITDRKAAERRLRESEERYRLLAENTVEMIVLTDMNAVRRYVSPACRRILGYEPHELVGHRPHDIVHPDDLAHVRATIDDLAAGRRMTATVQQRYRRKDDAYVWVEVSYQIYHDDDGQPSGCLACTRDISEQRSHAAALQEAKVAAERASQAKTDFLAAMSHEIRTPLNAIIGFTDLLACSGRLDPDSQRQVELVQSSGQALLTIVDDILDFSKVEAGAIELERHTFSPRVLAENCLSIVSGLAEARGLTVHAIIEAGLPEALLGDESRLRQILLNLLNNAIKFTAAGSVTLVVHHEGRSRDGEHLRFSVIDTGIGIPPETQTRLFQRFSQIDGSIQRDFGGTGLGLAICKNLVELMGGRIGVASQAGCGSTFWFTLSLPAAPALPETVPAPPSRSTRRGRILLVEDVEINRTLACTVLESAGHTVDVAVDGIGAVRAVEAASYDLVLMDIQMPRLDGMMATRMIRCLPGPAARVPVIAMSANVLPEQVQAFRAAGMDDHFGKPFKPHELNSAVTRWLDRSAGAGSEPGSEVEPALDRLHHADTMALIDPDTLVRLLNQFLDRAQGAFAGSGDAAHSASSGAAHRAEIRAEAHALAAASGLLGFLPLSRACSALERATDEAGFDALLDRARFLATGAVAEARAMVVDCAAAARTALGAQG